ncbi:exodeoxyribonuclease V subunit gamma [Pseudorhodoferax sp. Leaf267]|uniref:exodeoxyribonuclease V subunit gamma n=1 Tax=Pseudorhodoferax sp. Leaf267 TaxID=1736316 RepID=UPI0006F42422|nr:exodeoxyribonuclease V subunit gamma [Pseudorhodoferax sp. Leaf267]KQP13081.1 exodeoxyribonuclease V subunit gamma [Pseudorhodoferax sp. Leaf267]
MTDTTLAPGFMAVHSNHPEALRDLMLAWMARHPLAPLEDEWVLVQSNGVAQWLRLALAQPPSHGGVGIAAALRTELPSRFQWQAYRAVLGAQAVPAVSPFDKPLLVWRLMRLLPGLLHEDVFAPLRRFLLDDSDLRKRHQLAERLADLFDQYQVYRADWLADWGAGHDEVVTSRGGRQSVADDLLWQPRLWRALLADVGPEGAAGSRAAVHQRFMAAVQGWRGERPAGLPRRLVVFGISSLPQQSLEVLAALARWTQVLMCVHNPCAHDWSHIVADKDLLRAERSRQRRRTGSEGAIDDDSLHQHAQPLLAAWGKQGRDFIRLLDMHDEHEAYAERITAIGERIDVFDANAGDTVLHQLQDDIRDLRPLAETRAHWPAVQGDDSIRFHVTHGPQREVEVLHDQLLAAFAADPSLRPRDVIVMVPEVGSYAPHVQAVFGLRTPDDARHIPYSLADQAQRQHDPLLGALERLLALPQSRVATSDVLDWLEVPALRARFGIAAAQLPLLQRWVAAANVRWGLHAEQRRALDLPQAGGANSWDFGLQRMLLGYAVGGGDHWAGIEPLDEVGGLDAALLGPLAQLLETLQSHWRALAAPATPVQWGERLRALLADCFAPEADADVFTLRRLDTALQAWLDACAAAAMGEELPLSVVREHWLAQLDAPALSQPFFAGAVTFATLMPMRAIPFRVVALLGMNDGDYPRSRIPMDFDLMAQDWRPGDRSRREDDRYMFLEALLSARDRLHVSWVGRSIHDQSERAPSVLVAQLREHLAAGWRLAGDEALPQEEAGTRLLHALTVEHRLQPFHPAYFTRGGDARLFSHAREWRAGLLPAAPVAQRDAPLAPFKFDGPLTLRLLSSFLKEPARAFLQLRLGVHFDADDAVVQDQEPFALDGLQNWQLQDELIQAQKAALDADLPRDAALAAQLARMGRRGVLPAGHFGALVQAELAEPMDRMFAAYQQVIAAWPHALPDALLDYLPAGQDEPLRLVDWLGGLRADDAGARCRVLLESTGLVKDKRYRRDKLVPFWVAHVAGHLGGEALTTVVVSKAGTVTLAPMVVEEARRYWSVLLQAWQRGLCQPLPLALRTGFAWLEAQGTEGDTPQSPAWQKARVCYEGDDAARGVAEGGQSAYLARAFPSFEALWAQGAFAQWARTLLAPLDQAVQKMPKAAA